MPAEITWAVSVVAVLLFDVVLWLGTTGGRTGLHLQPAGNPWPRPDRGGSGPALRGVAPWLALIVVVLVWDILGIDTGPRQYHLTISALSQAYRPLNAAVLFVWILVGIVYEAARVRAPIDSAGAGCDEGAPRVQGNGGSFALAAGSLGTAHGTPALILPQSPAAGVAFWLAVPAAVLLVDAEARHSRGHMATAEEFVRFISTARLANLALIAAWGFAGYHLFAR